MIFIVESNESKRRGQNSKHEIVEREIEKRNWRPMKASPGWNLSLMKRRLVKCETGIVTTPSDRKEKALFY